MAEETTGELERTLGLTEAATIGMGTMIGAGIFVFPGMAAGEAGMAATVSFAIGAFVALLVALPCAELATAMPRSGGGYVFISRGLGAGLGAIVGIGLWWGLVFAAAFYLVGFGYYITDIFERLGRDMPGGVTMFAVIAGIALTVINVLGTKKSGKLQDYIVVLLLILLGGFLAYGVADVLGFSSGEASREFAPYGALPVLTTSSLVFTSYLGFAQVANVAGEVKRPGRTLPMAMIGSVVVVGVLYVGTIFVAVSVIPAQKLGELGETAMVEVAGELLGMPGAIIIMGAGLLATLSSANASLLSSSRSVYALGRDRLLPRRASEVNERFSTPHFSIIGAGVPIIALILLGRVELLAEVASFLHLVMYALMCFTAFWLRTSDPEWYEPTFEAPGYTILPILGGLASIGVMLFMNPLSIAIGVGIVGVAGGWYYVYARDVELKGEFDE